MWERLEKLEILLYEQQSVIAQLLEFYTMMGAAESMAEERTDVSASEGTRTAVETAEDSLQRTMKDLMEDAAAASVAGRDVVGEVSSVDITGSSSSAAAIISELQMEMGMGEMIRMPDEAFYRSLNNAYRDDLGGSETNVPPTVTSSQLGMIWEEAEDVEENPNKDETMEGLDRVEQGDETQEVFSALDYKDYRGNSPCVNEQDLAQLTRLSVIDQVALEKLQELDRLTTKLQKDSQNLKELQDRLLESPQNQYQKETRESESTASRALTEDTSVIDEQLRQIYVESELENWSFSSSARGLSELILLASTTTLPSGLSSSSKSRPSSRLSTDSGGATTDSEVASALSGFRSTVSPTTSPRHRVLLESSNSMDTSGILSSQASGRLSYNSSALLQADITSSCSLTSPKALAERYDFSHYAPEYTSAQEFQNIVTASYSSVPQTLPGTFTVASGQNLNSPPALSGSSIRTRQDGYIGGGGRMDLDLSESRITPSPSPASPPPPAPRDSGDAFFISPADTGVSAGANIPKSPSALLGASATATTTSITSPSTEQQGRLSPRTPHSPKSPRLSPKNIVKSTSVNIGTAKSDSGLSSMSGWSSVEKSPVSPKSVVSSTNKTPTSSSYASDSLIGRGHQQLLATSPIAPQLNLSSSSSISPQEIRTYNSAANSDSFQYSTPHSPVPPALVNSIITGGHHPSAFTSVKSPTSMGSSTPSITGDSSTGNLIPSPVPSSELSISPKGRSHRAPKSPSASTITSVEATSAATYGDYLYRSEQPAIYSVAGSNRQQSFTSVYTSGTSSYVPKSGSGYPDLVEPCSNNEQQHPAQVYRYHVEPERITSRSHSVGGYPTTSASSTSHSSRKNLSRGHSTGSAPPSGGGVANLEGYKTAMYRTMFPTGNITDALSYYPTSTRYDSTPSGTQPRSEYNHSSAWLSNSQAHVEATVANQMKHDHTSASIRSIDSAPASTAECGYMPPPYMDPRRYPQHTPQQQYGPPPGIEGAGEQDESYPREFSWGQRPDIQYLELDLRKRNAPDHLQQQLHDGQYCDPSSVIVSQSGYISIAADIKDNTYPQDEKVSKRGKLKSAMSSVSSWLPGLHLSKRHRSHSLPAGVRREDLVLSKEHGKGYMTTRGKSQPHSTSTLPRKKKKNPLASTMSGILQKAKRRSHHSQSLSDPEQSETEWSGRQSGLSEDSEDSVFSDAPSDSNVFAKVTHGMPRQHSLQQQQVLSNTRMGPRRDSDMDQVHELSYDTEPAETNPLEMDPSTLFPTVGEVKRAAIQAVTTSSEETPASEKLQFPPVALGGASREFAVSRALGKYRQRQSSTVSSEEQMGQDDISVTKINEQVPIVAKTDDEFQEDIYDEPTIETSIEEPQSISTLQQPSRTEELPSIEASPSVSSMRSYTSGRHHATRHQQSLEIPWSGSRGEADEDSRSTHSWRSTSRVSSRRQSTEDSIDSEDEWYCYELRKLEELERQQDTEPTQENKTEVFEPDEDVKEQMSFVLQELKLRARTREGVLEEDEYKRQVRARAEGSMMRWEDVQYDDGEKQTESYPIFSEQAPQVPVTEEPKKKIAMRLRDDDESSSGETSGPDSPHQSMDEMEVDEEEEAAMEAELARSVRSSSGSTLRHGEKPLQGSDSLSREGSVSVPPSEVSMSIPVSDGWDSEETATVREGSISIPASDVWEGEAEGEAGSDLREGAESSTPSIPKFKIDTDSSSTVKEDVTTKDSGPMGSKWKLLKALKERKAEEKIQEAATATAAAEAKANATTVGIKSVT